MDDAVPTNNSTYRDLTKIVSPGKSHSFLAPTKYCFLAEIGAPYSIANTWKPEGQDVCIKLDGDGVLDPNHPPVIGEFSDWCGTQELQKFKHSPWTGTAYYDLWDNRNKPAFINNHFLGAGNPVPDGDKILYSMTEHRNRRIVKGKIYNIGLNGIEDWEFDGVGPDYAFRGVRFWWGNTKKPEAPTGPEPVLPGVDNFKLAMDADTGTRMQGVLYPGQQKQVRAEGDVIYFGAVDHYKTLNNNITNWPRQGGRICVAVWQPGEPGDDLIDRPGGPINDTIPPGLDVIELQCDQANGKLQRAYFDWKPRKDEPGFDELWFRGSENKNNPKLKSIKFDDQGRTLKQGMKYDISLEAIDDDPRPDGVQRNDLFKSIRILVG